VLDVGCGTGDLAHAIARRGVRVVGVDVVAAAIDEARRRTPPDVAQLVEFRVGDATTPSRNAERFGSVVDSGFLHVLDAEQRDRFVRDLALALVDGGRYYLLAFAVEFPIPNTPLRVTEDELRSRFSTERGWRVVALRTATFETRVAGTPPVPAIAACFERITTTTRE
jgi:SAM-dependent methyltransferase